MSGIRSEVLVELILCRLSIPTKTAPSMARLSTSLQPYFSLKLTKPEWDSAFAKAIERARKTGLVDEKKLSLTRNGQSHLRKLLGREPRSSTWNQFERKELLGLLMDEAADADPLSAVIAKHLRCKAQGTIEKTVDGWLGERLGIKQPKLTLDGLRAALLAKELKLEPRPRLRDVAINGAVKLVDAQGGEPQQIVSALLLKRAGISSKKRAVRKVMPVKEAPSPRNKRGNGAPPGFVDRVLVAARSVEARRFGTNKTFIGSVWDQLRKDADMAKLGREGFAACLTDAHRRGAIVLSRADLVSAMNPEDVLSSEVRNLGATYHFINVGGS